ncbi:PH domain-containing protein [Solihabitans fulvus]|uniref:PH domain-containing protein n=1 Tax=Solihabitans fulvus TaxID=1892852 RepID=A0A5B2XFC4_9PSEU|nr:PH domain-containing protein [Solihabitans fulvus]KAA2261824.1 PH domain-containing protein [Solihabitans fulvus]
MAAQAEKPLVVRPRRARMVATVSAVVLVVVFVVVALLLKNTSTGVYFRTSDQVAMVGVGLLLAAGAMIFARPMVRADAEGIEVRNVFTVTRYPWTLVRQVSFPDGTPWARLDLPDDEYVAVMAVQAVDRERAVVAVRALRELHRRANAVAE